MTTRTATALLLMANRSIFIWSSRCGMLYRRQTDRHERRRTRNRGIFSVTFLGRKILTLGALRLKGDFVFFETLT